MRDQRNEVGRAEKGNKREYGWRRKGKKMKQGRVNLSKIGENKEKVGHRKLMQVSKIGFQY